MKVKEKLKEMFAKIVLVPHKYKLVHNCFEVCPFEVNHNVPRRRKTTWEMQLLKEEERRETFVSNLSKLDNVLNRFFFFLCKKNCRIIQIWLLAFGFLIAFKYKSMLYKCCRWWNDSKFFFVTWSMIENKQRYEILC